MNNGAFLGFILLLTAGWLHLFGIFKIHFIGTDELRAEIRHLHEEVAQQKLANHVEREHFYEFQQHVATLMPEVVKERGKGESGYPLRTLASVLTQAQSEQLKTTIAKTLFERGKKRFAEGEYSESNKILKRVIDQYGFIAQIPEAYFLLAEGYFQMGEYERCTRTVEDMVQIFPENELTGFSLLRLGKIYEKNNRFEEAVDLYKTVLKSFAQRDVASQAKKNLQGME